MVNDVRLKTACLNISEDWLSIFSPTMVDVFHLKTAYFDISGDWSEATVQWRVKVDQNYYPFPPNLYPFRAVTLASIYSSASWRVQSGFFSRTIWAIEINPPRLPSFSSGFRCQIKLFQFHYLVAGPSSNSRLDDPVFHFLAPYSHKFWGFYTRFFINKKNCFIRN